MPIVPSRPSREPSKIDVPVNAAATSPPPRQRARPEPVVEAQQPADQPLLKQASDYVVGYGRPPAHTRFKPGKSGNPRGRPKGPKGLNTLVREVMTAKVPVRTGTGEKKMHRVEAVLHKAFELALKGNPRAQSQILSLYASAVPERVVADSASPVEELSATDHAILEEFKASLFREEGL
jgi:uncharacterized protein DUF5681